MYHHLLSQANVLIFWHRHFLINGNANINVIFVAQIGLKSILKSVPGTNRLLESYYWRLLRYKLMLRYGDRQNTTFTGFLRLPSQFDALSGPVIDFLLTDETNKSLKITVLGCSNGAEPYSIASVLLQRRQEIDFKIYAYDILREIIFKARMATYERQEIFCNPKITPEFVNETFMLDNSFYKVKKMISEHVVFSVGDALDINLKNIIGSSDIVFAQNFIVHLKPKLAMKAFHNIYCLMNPLSALFIDGIDLDLRQRLTRIYKLEPLNYKIIEIHEEAQKERSYMWPQCYWSIEPLSTSRKDWKRRYSTIFLKNDHVK